MASLINRLIPTTAKELLKRKSGVPDIFFSIERLKEAGFAPTEIVDVGAYEGEWTKRCSCIYPEARFLMIEAMQAKSPVLQTLCAAEKKMRFEIGVLGAESGKEVFFSEIETASSVLEEVVTRHDRTRRKTVALDEIIEKNNIDKVDFLKLDVQGYELEVLKGFRRHIENTEVILSEVSLLDIHKGVPLVRDVLNFMYEFSFVAFDICSVNIRRPLDGALWQTDLLFVKENSRFRSNKAYCRDGLEDQLQAKH